MIARRWRAFIDSIAFVEQMTRRSLRPRLPGGDTATLRRLRVGVQVDGYWQEVEPAISEAAAAAVHTLQRRGAQIVEIRTPMIAELAAAYPAIAGPRGTRRTQRGSPRAPTTTNRQRV